MKLKIILFSTGKSKKKTVCIMIVLCCRALSCCLDNIGLFGTLIKHFTRSNDILYGVRNYVDFVPWKFNTLRCYH